MCIRDVFYLPFPFFSPFKKNAIWIIYWSMTERAMDLLRDGIYADDLILYTAIWNIADEAQGRQASGCVKGGHMESLFVCIYLFVAFGAI